MRASSPSSWVRGLLFPFIAGLMHAGLMVYAFPPVGVWPLVALAPLPLIWAAVASGAGTGGPRAARPWHPAWAPFWASLGAAPMWAYEQSWVMDVSGAGYYPFVGGLAAFAGVFVWALRRAVRRWPRVPLTWLVPLV